MCCLLKADNALRQLSIQPVSSESFQSAGNSTVIRRKVCEGECADEECSVTDGGGSARLSLRRDGKSIPKHYQSNFPFQ